MFSCTDLIFKSKKKIVWKISSLNINKTFEKDCIKTRNNFSIKNYNWQI